MFNLSFNNYYGVIKMNDNNIKILLEIKPNEDIDKEDLLEITRFLREQIEDGINVISIGYVKKTAPKGTMGVGMMEVGKLLVSLSSSLLKPLFDIIGPVCKKNNATVTINGQSLSAEGLTKEQMDRIIDIYSVQVNSVGEDGAWVDVMHS